MSRIAGKAYSFTIYASCIIIGIQTASATELSNRITTEGNSKAKGLLLQMDYPATWGFNDAKRPNTVTNAFSDNGKGLDGCVTTIHINDNAKGSGNYSLPKEARKMISSNPSAIYYEIAERNSLSGVSGGKTIVDGELGVWLTGNREEERFGIKMYNHFFITLFWYKKWITTITCTSGGDSVDSAAKQFEKTKPLFQKITLSTVILSKWLQQ